MSQPLPANVPEGWTYVGVFRNTKMEVVEFVYKDQDGATRLISNPKGEQ
jgi:hypothetical protein